MVLAVGTDPKPSPPQGETFLVGDPRQSWQDLYPQRLALYQHLLSSSWVRVRHESCRTRTVSLASPLHWRVPTFCYPKWLANAPLANAYPLLLPCNQIGQLEEGSQSQAATQGGLELWATGNFHAEAGLVGRGMKGNTSGGQGVSRVGVGY